MELVNRTALSTEQLRRMFLREVAHWPHERIHATVRYSRGADYSGTCYYRTGHIYVNLGRHVRFPYSLPTSIARAESNATHWWKEVYSLRVADAYELVLFVFLHEFYHWLVGLARRNPRQKESMCDRFAARVLVSRYGALVRDSRGRRVLENAWDFQDLDGFVAAARPPVPTRLRRAAATRRRKRGG